MSPRKLRKVHTKGEIDPSSVDPPFESFDGVPLPYRRRPEKSLTTVREIEEERRRRISGIPHMSASSVHTARRRDEKERRRSFLKRFRRKSWDE